MLNKKNLTTLSSALLISMAAPSAVTADSFEANLNNETIQVEYEAQIPATVNIFANASVLYADESDKHSALVGALGFQGVETDNETYRAAVGARLYLYDHGKQNGAAVAVGGLFYHAIPGYQRLSAGGYGWYAPRVTSFGNTEQIFEVGARVAFRVIQNGDVFAGYRYLKVKNKSNGVIRFNDSLDNSPHIGFRLNF